MNHPKHPNPPYLPQRPYSQRLGPKPLLLASFAMILTSLVIDFDGLSSIFLSSKSADEQANCHEVVSEAAKLSREQLAKLLTIPERDAKERVRQVVSEPYCQLPTLNVRSGVAAEREAYPLEFDPGTTLVILYENNEYAGYRFSFN